MNQIKTKQLQNKGSRDPYLQVVWSPQTTTISYKQLRSLWELPFGRMRFCSTKKSFQKFLYDFIPFPCVLITSLIHSKCLEQWWITSSFCLQWSLGAIFDGAAFSTKRSRAQFFVKYCIQFPFEENVTAIIKSWRFLEGALSYFTKRWHM